MWNSGKGFMAIWSDVSPADFDFYHDWLLKEHFEERVRVPGFISARVFRRDVGDDLRFFIIYETESPDVLASASYVDRLNNPTEKSQKVMPKLKNFVRGAGRVVQSVGFCGGGAVKVFRFAKPHDALTDAGARSGLFSAVAKLDRVLSVRLFEVDATATTIPTEEKKIRTSAEEIFSQLLVVEAVDADALNDARKIVDDALTAGKSGVPPFAESYRLIAELHRRSLS